MSVERSERRWLWTGKLAVVAELARVPTEVLEIEQLPLLGGAQFQALQFLADPHITACPDKGRGGQRLGGLRPEVEAVEFANGGSLVLEQQQLALVGQNH